MNSLAAGRAEEPPRGDLHPGDLSNNGLKQVRANAGKKQENATFFFYRHTGTNGKGVQRTTRRRGGPNNRRVTVPTRRAQETTKGKNMLKENFFFYRQPRINKKGVHRTNRRRGGPSPRLRETIRTHGTEEKKNCRKYARTLGKHRVRKQFFFIGTLELTEMGFKRRGGHKRRRATIRTHGTEAKNIC